MTLFLTSSPFVQNAPRAILNAANGFAERLRHALPERPKCLFVCSDPDSWGLTDGFARDMAEACREIGIVFSAFSVLDSRNAYAAEELVKESDLLVFAGGHVPTQNRFFRDIGLRELVRDFPGVIVGISAGTMNCASMVYAQPEMPGESIDPRYQRFVPGLDLTWVNILPHYQQVKDYTLDGRRLYEDITFEDSLGHTFFALPDGSYVYCREGLTLLCGEGYRIEDGQMVQLTCEGDTLSL